MPLSELEAVQPPVSTGAAGMVSATSFSHLEKQARRLQWMVIALLVIITAVPASTAMVFELRHLQEHASEHAEWLGRLIAARYSGSLADLESVLPIIRQEMEAEDVVSLLLVDQQGHDVLRIGKPGETFFPTGATFVFPPARAPLQRITVEYSDRSLLRRSAQVASIHVIVAGILMVMFQLPMRALRAAVAGIKATHEQLIHSDKLSAIGEMYAAFTHEINNPLAIILSRVKLLLAAARERPLPTDVVDDLEMIDRQGSRIAEIIRSLLAFARRATFDLADMDVNHVVGEVVALVERPFAKHGITMHCRLGEDLPRVQGSPSQLQQVFVNLLNNARDAMPGGGTVTVRTYRNGRHVMMEVQDLGTGIAPEIQRRIFEPFFTTKGVGKGTGLGLAVSYGIVRAHGGEIEVESAPGNGALFRVTLPVPPVAR